jgi:DNA polymerase-3 subunit epsilon
MDSYSLGKLSRSLGIEIKDRHRAGGDALATAHLFTMLLEKDPGELQTFVQHEINPKILHPNLNLEDLDEIPGKTGVYKFYNEFNQLIYIGKSKHIKTRVDQHLRNSKTKKGIQMMKEIMRIEYELTGSELIALLRESQMIKVDKPVYNHALKKSKFPYGLFDYIDDKGYQRLYIGLTSKTNEIPSASFTTKKEGMLYLERLCEEYNLCQKLCDLYTSKSSCFHYEIKKCEGACIQKESTENYNWKVEDLINTLCLNKESFYIVDKGRHKSEKSLILIEQGAISGFGYAPYHFQGQAPFRWKRFIDLINEDRDYRTILNVFLRKNPLIEIIRF